ncbi:hypothetical protein ACFR99_14470 [Haloarchaeobius amylolyticus]|uniref:Uncharacterized protein n=1 Tax=Haloarchaeobius amylolyticus TaxID=1198296 RepID=A0ABD6BJ60_9EURY
MREGNSSNGDRGQAYTLEGLISAMVVLMAVLFALQSAVITPTTGGLNDRTVQAQVQQEVQDALVVAANNESGNLSNMTRHWNGEGGFEDASGPQPPGENNSTYEADEDGNFTTEFTLGDILYERFGENGQNYNVEAHYEDGDAERDHKTLVYQGSPPSGAVTASYTVTLYDEQETTGDDYEQDLINSSDDDKETIPYRDAGSGPVYNVVEIRVIVW